MTPDRFYYKAIQAYNKAKIEGPSNKTRSIALFSVFYSFWFAIDIDKAIYWHNNNYFYITTLKYSYLWKRMVKRHKHSKKITFINLLNINIL